MFAFLSHSKLSQWADKNLFPLYVSLGLNRSLHKPELSFTSNLQNFAFICVCTDIGQYFLCFQKYTISFAFKMIIQ